MQSDYASCHYVVTTTPTYCTAIVDLSRSRSVHAVEHNPCCPDPTILSAADCKAVHYGLCSPLLKLPSFSIVPSSAVTSPSLSSPTSSKGSVHQQQQQTPQQSPKDVVVVESPKCRSNTNSPKINSSSPVVSPTAVLKNPFQQQQHPQQTVEAGPQDVPGANPVTNKPMSKVDLEIFDPVELLAADLEGKLEALVNSFVAQDKVRLAARKKSDDRGQVLTKTLPRNQQLATPPPSPGNNNEVIPNSQQLLQSSPELDEQHGGSGVTAPKYSKPNPIDVERSSSLFKDGMNVAKQSLEFLQSRNTPSPTITPPLKPSLEYQQSGVKAQITKFSSIDKDPPQSPVNSLERRQVVKPSRQENSPAMTPSFKPGPLSLDELQELLKSTSEPFQEPIQTTVFENSRLANLHYDSKASPLQPNHVNNREPLIYSQRDANGVHPEAVNQNLEAIKSFENSSHPHYKQFEDVLLQEVPYKLSPTQDYVQSPVDYAKSRFQNVQHGKQDTESKPRPVKNGQLVTEAKYKWENLPQGNWGNLPLSEQQMVVVENGDTNGHRRVMSMEGLFEAPSPSIPHPKLTNVQKQHIKERSLSPTDRHSHVPIRPFLTKGSVAERVLLFECCPDRALERATSGTKAKNLLINTWRASGSDVHNKMQSHHYTTTTTSNRDKENVDPRTNSLRRFAASKSPSSNKIIPRFYYPDGKPATSTEIETHLKRVAAVFAGLTEGKANREEFGIITKACGLPLYWKLPLFLAARGDKRTSVSCEVFLEYWRRVVNACHDEASKFVFVMSRGSRNYLLPEDFNPLMQDVIDSHPGLTFLKEATEFHTRYIHTVTARIYYCVNRSWSGKITVPELRKSNFLQVLSALEEEEDINQITDYFSYEHFYVIYCKFWELDKDHDLYIDQNDLRHHNGGALSTKIIQRLFSGAVTRGPIQKEGKMSYSEFVWFLISEEDKRHPRSIEYWFRCMDLDGDGYLSMYELEYFYQEQLQRLEALGIETLPFNDCLCQMLDIIKPKTHGRISLSDLKKCKMTPIFFDTFFNLEKYLDHEQRDPFASQREHDGEGPELSDWDRYAADEYELLVAEEGAEHQDDMMVYEDAESSRTSDGGCSNPIIEMPKSNSEEEYDYADTDAEYKF